MPRAIVFSDIHHDMAALNRLMETPADAYFAAGDMVNWGRGLHKIASTITPRQGQLYLLPGNHESEADIDSFCREFGFTNFHGKTAEIGGLRFAGLGYSTPTPFDTPGEYTDAEIARRLEPFAAYEPDVLICHCPPFNTPLDQIKEGLHAGSRSIRDFIERHQPSHFFCGHIHEAEGVVIQMGRTRAMNVGKPGYVLEW
jgi:Icc-related predicted phosphoesterase